jgi:RHS repeat-associated protein
MKKIIYIITALLLMVANFEVLAEKVVYIHSDVLGSPVAETDEGGNLTWTEHYSPFGEKIDDQDEAKENSVGYTGHQFDGDTGLSYMQARYYDPVIGRFYSNDPVGYTASNPVMSFNRYLYVNNNPYKYTDPNGEFLNFVASFVVNVAVESAIQYATTGTVDIGSALGDAAIGMVNPAKALQRIKKVAGLVKASGKGCSFTPETIILTKDGYKTIVEINIGDFVLSKNDETGDTAWRKVTDTFKDWHTETITFTVIDENGVEESVTTTAEHPFYIDNQGWTPAGDILAGTTVSGPKSENDISIVSIQVNQDPQYAYNFTVDTDHTYFVGKTNMWVHNRCKAKSASQMQQKVKKDQAPSGIKRFDPADSTVKSSQDHVHKTDGTSMNVDGTVHDKKNGVPKFTNKEKKFLKENKWPTEPKND